MSIIYRDGDPLLLYFEKQMHPGLLAMS